MTQLPQIHEFLLLNALGLLTNPHPTREWLPENVATKYPADVDSLKDSGLLKSEYIHGEGGTSHRILITALGREVALEAHQRQQADAQANIDSSLAAPLPDALADAPAKPKRARRTKAEIEAAAGAQAGDLLAAAGIAPAPGMELVAAVGQDLIAAVMPTMDASKVVATVFEPFRTKFDQVRAEADLIAFTEEGKAHAEALQAELPEDQRQLVQLVDVSTKEGYALAIKYRAVFRDDVRLAAEKRHKERKAPILTIGRLLDSTFNAIRDEAKPYEDRFDAVIKAEDQRKEREKREAEERERARVAVIRAKIDAITCLPGKLAGASSEMLLAELQALAQVEPTEEEFGDYLGEMMLAVETVGSALDTLLGMARNREAQEAQRIKDQQEREAKLKEQAEANERAATALAEQRAALERQRKEQDAAELAAQVRQNQQLAAMESMKHAQEYAEMTGSAYELESIRAIAATIDADAHKFGMSAPIVAMARDMAISQLQARIAVAVAAELPALYEEALQENERISMPQNDPVMVDTVAGFQEMSVPEPMNWDLSEPVLVEVAPEPAPAPKQERVSTFRDPMEDRAAVEALRAAVRAARATRTGLQIESIVAQELAMIEVERRNAKVQ